MPIVGLNLRQMLFKVVILKVLCRIVAAIAFTVIWHFWAGIYTTIAAPIAFFAMLYLTAAWLNYLRMSGLPVFAASIRGTTKADMDKKEIKTRLDGMNGIDSQPEDDEEESAKTNKGTSATNKDEAKLAIKVNLIAAGILVLLSFIVL